MKTYIILLLLSVTLFMVSCEKEPGLPGTADVVDPFTRIDKADNPVDHLIYQVYQDVKVPILYTDTVRKSPLMLLNINYHLTGTDTQFSLRYMKNKEDILAAVNFVRDKIIPSLGGSLKPYSVLVADSIITQSYDPGDGKGTRYTLANSYQGLNCLVIGNVPAIKNMTTAQQTALKVSIFTNILTAALNNGTYLNDFYAISKANYYYYVDKYHGFTAPFPVKETFGILSDGTESATTGYYIRDKTYDLSLYLTKALSITPEAFKLTYANYPLVLKKYDLLQKAMVTLGFKQI